jgi:hypothetical protein
MPLVDLQYDERAIMFSVHINARKREDFRLIRNRPPLFQFHLNSLPGLVLEADIDAELGDLEEPGVNKE